MWDDLSATCPYAGDAECSATVRAISRGLRIAITYGPQCLLRSPDVTQSDPRTGSEIGFVRIAEELERLGHVVSRHCGLDQSATERYDVAIAINEPDRLRTISAGLKVCEFWLNGTDFCEVGFDDFVDEYISPSRAHMWQAVGQWHVPHPSKWRVIPLGCDPERYGATKISGRAVYCSSPDRGLHRVLESWPAIKRAVPRATLHVFYRLREWIDSMKAMPHYQPIERLRTRALYVEDALDRMSGAEWGITVRDSVSREVLIAEMSAAEVLLHPCETTSWSEGFSCTVLEGCAAQACPVVSDCDALGEVYADLEPFKTGDSAAFRERTIRALTDEAFRAEMNAKARALAERLTWRAHTERLDEVIRGRV